MASSRATLRTDSICRQSTFGDVTRLHYVRLSLSLFGRFLTVHAAHLMDTVGNKEAKKEIAAIKVMIPSLAIRSMASAVVFRPDSLNHKNDCDSLLV